MRVILCILMVVASGVVVGCNASREIGPADLPAYGNDPLNHTTYVGSDATHHHFVSQHGKSRTRYRIALAEATIKPVPFPRSNDWKAFVKSINGRTIHYVTFQDYERLWESIKSSAPTPAVVIGEIEVLYPGDGGSVCVWFTDTTGKHHRYWFRDYDPDWRPLFGRDWVPPATDITRRALRVWPMPCSSEMPPDSERLGIASLRALRDTFRAYLQKHHDEWAAARLTDEVQGAVVTEYNKLMEADDVELSDDDKYEVDVIMATAHLRARCRYITEHDEALLGVRHLVSRLDAEIEALENDRSQSP